MLAELLLLSFSSSHFYSTLSFHLCSYFSAPPFEREGDRSNKDNITYPNQGCPWTWDVGLAMKIQERLGCELSLSPWECNRLVAMCLRGIAHKCALCWAHLECWNSIRTEDLCSGGSTIISMDSITYSAGNSIDPCHIVHEGEYSTMKGFWQVFPQEETVVFSVSWLGYLYDSHRSHVKLCSTLCIMSWLPLCQWQCHVMLCFTLCIMSGLPVCLVTIAMLSF